MRRRLAFGVLLLAALGLAVTTSAGKPAKPPLGTPVTVVFADRDGDRIQSDNSTPYVNGVDGVTALIVPLGNLQLKTGDVRTFWLDFGACIDGSCDSPTTGDRHGYTTTSCLIALPSMTVGGSQGCNMIVHFTADQKGWFIRFGEYPGTDPATVKRVSSTSWTIDVPAEGIALLQSYPLKGRVVYEDHGHYSMPFGLTVTLQ